MLRMRAGAEGVPVSVNLRAARCVSRMRASAFSRSILTSTSSSIEASGPKAPNPALLTRMSKRKSRLSARATVEAQRCSTARASDKSAATGWTSMPQARQRSAHASRSRALQALMTRLTPAWARFSATARPMPLVAPVTRASERILGLAAVLTGTDGRCRDGRCRRRPHPCARVPGGAPGC